MIKEQKQKYSGGYLRGDKVYMFVLDYGLLKHSGLLLRCNYLLTCKKVRLHLERPGSPRYW